jgi:3-deoxy-D-manno-octulosonic-acid transferase
VGEAGSALTLILELSRLAPKEGFALSVSTPQGLAYAAGALDSPPFGPDGPRVRLMAPPLDFFGAPGRTLARVSPKALVIVETELWPGLILKAKSLGLPVLVAAGRLSRKSIARYRRAAFLFKDIAASLDLVCANGEDDRQGFLEIGARPESTVALGNPKFDKLVAIARDEPYRPVSLSPPYLLVAGSTHPGEEELILRTVLRIRLTRTLAGREEYIKGKLILAPRHLGRVPEVLALAKRLGLEAAPLSSPDVPRRDLPGVGVVDVVGRLLDFYRAADLAIVCGSFVNGQGHNPLEPAALGRPVIFGPNMSSFSEQARLLMDNLACKMILPVDLPSAISHFMDIPQISKDTGINAKRAVAALPLAAPPIAERILEAIALKAKGA